MIVDSDVGILIGGGRDNQIIGNKFIHTDISLFIDKRGLTWTSQCKEGGAFEAELNQYNYKHPPWSVHYPELASTFSDRPCTPVNNVIRDVKLCLNSTSWFLSPDSDIAEFLLWSNSFSDIVEDKYICDASFLRVEDTEWKVD